MEAAALRPKRANPKYDRQRKRCGESPQKGKTRTEAAIGWRRVQESVELSAMTRSELIAALAARFPRLMDKDAEIAVREILDAIGQSLARGGRVEIRGFGSFALNHRPARIGRNPKTGEKVQVPAKYAPHFKAAKELRERVDPTSDTPPIRLAA